MRAIKKVDEPQQNEKSRKKELNEEKKREDVFFLRF